MAEGSDSSDSCPAQVSDKPLESLLHKMVAAFIAREATCADAFAGTVRTLSRPDDSPNKNLQLPALSDIEAAYTIAKEIDPLLQETSRPVAANEKQQPRRRIAGCGKTLKLNSQQANVENNFHTMVVWNYWLVWNFRVESAKKFSTQTPSVEK